MMMGEGGGDGVVGCLLSGKALARLKALSPMWRLTSDVADRRGTLGRPAEGWIDGWQTKVGIRAL